MKKENITVETTEKNPKKKMKKWKKVLLIVLCVLVVGVTTLTIWQWNNIKAVYYWVTVGSTENIAKEIEATKKEREEIVSEYINGKVRDFTEEEEEKIVSGELSVEEATKIIKDEFEESVKTSEEKEPSKKNSKEIDDFIADNIIQLYSYKAYYLGQLGQIEKAAIADYKALSPKDRTMVSKQAIVDKYIGTANALLVECDGKVHKIMDTLSKKLKENKMDTAIVDKINSSYEEEKALKKAYYMSLLNK